MAKTITAAVVRGFGRPLAIEEVPLPTPGPGEVLVEIMASGVCHTNLHAADGYWPVKPALPFIPGHEGAGIVSALGAGVAGRERTNARRGGGRVEGDTWWRARRAGLRRVGPAFGQALQMVRRKGTVSLVGPPPGEFPTPIFDVVIKRITIRGSIVGTRQDLTGRSHSPPKGRSTRTSDARPWRM